jgi:hypothetical protein
MMHGIYSKYRELKREIRDNAASDVQRLYRGFRVRSQIRKHQKGLSLSRSDVILDGRLPQQQQQSKAGSAVSNTNSKGLTADAFGHAQSLFKRYRELRETKRELKKRLKKFDEEFFSQHGRDPKKTDKEVIRPMYQKYHEMKSALEELRIRLQQGKDPIPEDLMEEICAPQGNGASANSLLETKRFAPSPAFADSSDYEPGKQGFCMPDDG